MSNPNIDINVSGPVQPTSTYKTKVLKGNQSFASQIYGKTNHKFVIKYDFDLGGASVTIPENCVLQFEGGSISNGTLIGQNTELMNPQFSGITFGGSFTNYDAELSWFNKEADKDSVVSCISLAAKCVGKTADFQNIEKTFSGTIEIDETKDVNWENANFIYIPTRDYDVAFDFKSNTTWVGGGKKILDCVFKCSSTSTYKGVSCLLYSRWYNSNVSLWENIRVYDFTGYFLVNCGNYLPSNKNADFQQVAIRDVTCRAVGGFISYNSEGHYGTEKGSSNIVLIENCSCNNDASASKYEGINAVVDLRSCKEVTFLNCTFQGSIASGKCVLRITEGIDSSFYYPTVILDGFWTEYVNYTHTEEKIVIDCSAAVIIKGKTASPSIAVKENNTILDFSQLNFGQLLPDYLSQIHIADNVNTASITIETAASNHNAVDLSEFVKLMDKGVLLKIENKAGCGAEKVLNSPVFSIKGENAECDVFPYILDNVPTKGNTAISIRYDNNCHIIKMENQSVAVTSDIIRITPWDAFGNMHKKGACVIADFIYRKAPTETISSNNIDDSYVVVPQKEQAFQTDQKDYFKIGDEAGVFGSWKRVTLAVPLQFTSGGVSWLQLMLGSSKAILEIAKFKIHLNICSLDADVIVSSDGTYVKNVRDNYSIRTFAINKQLSDAVKNSIVNCTNTVFKINSGLYISNGSNIMSITPSAQITPLIYKNSFAAGIVMITLQLSTLKRSSFVLDIIGTNYKYYSPVTVYHTYGGNMTVEKSNDAIKWKVGSDNLFYIYITLPEICSVAIQTVDVQDTFNCTMETISELPIGVQTPILAETTTISNKTSGTFANRPTSDIYVGYRYFCTDKQTTEGATNGIEIIHKGSDVWVDALGRVVS